MSLLLHGDCLELLSEVEDNSVDFIFCDLPYGQTCKKTNPWDIPLDLHLLWEQLIRVKSTKGSHSTEKPVELIEYLLKYFSKEGDTILDPTMGSGSTGLACKNMNRNFIGMEKDSTFYNTATNRIT